MKYSRRWEYEIFFAALVAAACGLALSPVLRRSGFPLNEGSTAPLLLVQMYAAHFRHLDFLPVWSSSDGIGLGTPVLLFYHRTFFYVSGLILVVTGNLKFSVMAALGVFLAVGAYGMRAALGVITDSRLLRVVGSIGFLFTNYVFTDWLDPRGDLAEFSALMLVPWLLYWCLTLLRSHRASWLLVPVMVLLVNAHSAVALYTLFTMIIALATFVVTAGIAGLRQIARRMVVIAAATTAILAPVLVAELQMCRFYDPQTKNSDASPVSHQFVSFGSYFNGVGHRWFAPMGHLIYFVQIDFAIWVPVAVALVAVMGRALLRRNRERWRPWPGLVRPTTVFVLASLVVYLFLQLRISLFVYRIIAPLQVTNFPWRMLSFITPLGVVLVVILADSLMVRYPHRALWGAISAVWLGSLVALAPLASGVAIDYGLLAAPGAFPPMQLFTAPTHVDYRTFRGFFLGASVGELYTPFLPKVAGPQSRELEDDDSLYRRLHAHDAGAQSLGPERCSVVEPTRAPFETLQLKYTVNCQGPARLALPVSYNASSSVFVVEHGKLHRIPYLHLAGDPRIVISVTAARNETVVVHLPTLWGILS